MLTKGHCPGGEPFFYDIGFAFWLLLFCRGVPVGGVVIGVGGRGYQGIIAFTGDENIDNGFACIKLCTGDHVCFGHAALGKGAVVLDDLHFRIVRFPISESTYETIITNLDKDAFPIQEIKRLYAMRWGIETSFRDLKYTLALLHLHAKKVDFIYQEIFAKLTMYNFCQMITQSVAIQTKKRKYSYKISFSDAVHICLQAISHFLQPSGQP